MTNSTPSPAADVNTDREIYRSPFGSMYDDSIHVTQGGGIGFNVGDHVIVRPLRDWHALATALTAPDTAAASPWLPIDSAPRKDEVNILVTDARVKDFFAVVCWWHTNEKFPWQTDDGVSYHADRFTHWQPLPAPPAPPTEG